MSVTHQQCSFRWDFISDPLTDSSPNVRDLLLRARWRSSTEPLSTSVRLFSGDKRQLAAGDLNDAGEVRHLADGRRWQEGDTPTGCPRASRTISSPIIAHLVVVWSHDDHLGNLGGPAALRRHKTRLLWSFFRPADSLGCRRSDFASCPTGSLRTSESICCYTRLSPENSCPQTLERQRYPDAIYHRAATWRGSPVSRPANRTRRSHCLPCHTPPRWPNHTPLYRRQCNGFIALLYINY